MRRPVPHLAAARKIFARDGYAKRRSVHREAARVTTRRVYHHFGDKKGLFRAVAETRGRLLQKILATAAQEKDAWSA